MFFAGATERANNIDNIFLNIFRYSNIVKIIGYYDFILIYCVFTRFYRNCTPLIAGESVPFHAKFKENNILSNTPKTRTHETTTQKTKQMSNTDPAKKPA
jgi:hypothetical protein